MKEEGPTTTSFTNRKPQPLKSQLPDPSTEPRKKGDKTRPMPGEWSPPPATKRQRSEPDEEIVGGGESGEGSERGGGGGERRLGSAAGSCGICLAEEGKAVRGEIECCGHYFCFVCILEWARVETRCPICKRRFSTIRRPPKPGVFPSHRLVNVSQRDQASFLHGNAGGFDPYDHVQCTVCRSSKDDYLLLLCDLCDSASHTYCIGLGNTVPEGDWFCNDCSVSRAEYDESQRDSEGDNDGDKVPAVGACEKAESEITGGVEEQTNWASSDLVRTDTGEFISVYEIVHQSDDFPRRLDLSSTSPTAPMNLWIAKTGSSDQNTMASATEKEVRTLKRCRNVQKCIRSFRDNWEALRSGSLSFSSFPESTSGSDRRHDVIPRSCNRSDEPRSSSNTNYQSPIKPGVLKNSAKETSRPYDVEKAWKMLDKAKSVHKAHGRIKRVQQEVMKHPLLGKSSSLTLTSRDASHPLSIEVLGNTKSKSQNQHCTVGKQTENNIFQKLRNQCTSQDDSSKFSKDAFSPGIVAFSSPLKKDTINDFSSQNHRPGLQKKQSPRARQPLILEDERDGFCSSTTSAGVPGASGLMNDRSYLSSCSSTADFSKQSNSSVKRSITGKTRAEEDAKSAIQSLVKLNLKLRSKDKRLEVDMFKEIARQSTHTILAACGLPHSSSARIRCPRAVCSHSEQLQQQSKSILMPNTCQECFVVFVKDVVDSVFSEKTCKSKW